MKALEPTSLYGYLKNPSMVDYPGRLAATFFTAGCNFSCGFCHNATLMGSRKLGLTWEALQQAVTAFRSDWVEAVCISGGEPTLAPDLEALVRFFKDSGFAVKLDSNGSKPDVLAKVLPLIDYVAMDVKCSLPSYPDFVRHHRPEAIERSIRLIKESGVSHEFRTTVVGSFHTDEEMTGIGEAVAGANRFVVQPFLPREGLPEPMYSAEPRTPPTRLREVEAIMMNYVDDVVVRGAGIA